MMMQVDHVGVRVSSLEREIARLEDATDTTIHDIPGGIARDLWGGECGALRLWFRRDSTGVIEFFEQSDTSATALPSNHMCFAVESIVDTIPWWEGIGFHRLSTRVVQIGDKQTVMLRSADGVIVQLVSVEHDDDGGE